ncbi:MAG: ABC transporter ATP-binding protein [Candidatus Zixiibacteriota bacterium]|nr:MAG: ABC transporter ATP-binding protein [candidate division Zixibacteria bacterium]
MSRPFVQLQNVNKSYWRDSLEIPVLNDVNLDLPEGEFVALMGPSGSGKTTLLNLIAGIDRPSSGNVIVRGQNVSRLSEGDLARWRSDNIGFVFQFYNLMPVLTAYENVELPLLLTKLSRSERRRQVETALSIVGLADRMKHYPNQLSGGQEQRVAIARAVVTDPVLILADEPTGDLDKVSAQEVMDLLSRLNHEFNKTIIMVTHDPRAAEKAHTQRHLDKGVLNSHESPQAG